MEENRQTIMEFSGATIATSLALSALPDDFASPLAGTLTDMNKYFVFIFAVLFVEELIVVEGINISFSYIIPFACLLYGASILFKKELFKEFAIKIAILGLAIVVVVPVSTHFTEAICDEYLAYVDETIAEADAGATKVNDVMATSNEDATFFDKLSDAFETAIKDVTTLLEYFNNVIKKCVNSVSMELSDRLIEKLDFDFLKKTQTVSYTGTGYFVVNLDQISKADVIEDKVNKSITIKIENAELQIIEIDPDKIMIAEVKEGLFARGDIEMTVSDYNAIEKELRNKLQEKFDTVKNGQEADEIALRMVKEIYEPIVKAIDARYRVVVEFK